MIKFLKEIRLIDFNSVFLFICKYNFDDSNTYNSTLSSLIIDNVINTVSKTTFILKLNMINSTYFIKLNNEIIKYFYDIVKNDKNDKIEQRDFYLLIAVKYIFKNHYQMILNQVIIKIIQLAIKVVFLY